MLAAFFLSEILAAYRLIKLKVVLTLADARVISEFRSSK